MEGRVIKSTGSWYLVAVGDKLVKARLRGKFKKSDLKLTNPIAVGDFVHLIGEEDQETAVIADILPRENYIIRKSTRKSNFSHILASNIDQAMLIITVLKPRTSLGFVDRFLVSTESFRIPATLVVNKADLIQKEKDLEFLQTIKEIYEPLGYPVITVSALQDEAVPDKINPLLENKTTLMAGHSGVGKSTLLNLLIPEAQQHTREISNFTSKGVHTTTFAEMFTLPNGGSIIDTPGIKEFGILEIGEEELSHYFVEMRKYLGQCKYNNCKHVNEPGCRVIEMVGNGEIHPYRYDSYLKILYEEDTFR